MTTLSDALTAYRISARAEGKSPRTIEWITSSITYFREFLGTDPDIAAITADDLEALNLPADTRRLLLRTRNSEGWQRGDREFRTDFVALTADAARWVVARDIRLIGVDYLSVQIFRGDPATHIALLQAQVVIVEGLNLAQVVPGNYELICLPLKLAGAEGAPARAVLRTLPA